MIHAGIDFASLGVKAQGNTTLVTTDDVNSVCQIGRSMFQHAWYGCLHEYADLFMCTCTCISQVYTMCVCDVVSSIALFK